MKYLFVRTQLFFVSVILLVTFALMMILVMRYNYRWDFTKEKIFSLAQPTADLLEELSSEKIEVFAFYPQDDPAREHFEVFLKQALLHHPRLTFNFYDPDRAPNLAKQFQIKDLYTVIIQYQGRQERVLAPTEEGFTSALLRLAHPKQVTLCFVTGHGEAALSQEDRSGYSFFRDELLNNNYQIQEIILDRDRLPSACDVYVVAGPHRDLEEDEYTLLKQAFRDGKGIFFLVDPMDQGTGGSFRDYMDYFGITLGEDVIVDKMSRVVGGDFLVPLVNQYVVGHPITLSFEHPTFFPVARSVQPSTKAKRDIRVEPLALSGSNSWAETNLAELEQGEAVFESDSDLAGPICLAVAAEEYDQSQKDSVPGAQASEGGRLVVVGDSDFLTNAYLDLSGNKYLALKMVQWLAKDDRFIAINPRQPEFEPLYLKPRDRILMLVIFIGALPLAIFFLGAFWVIWRKKTG
ncbi:MAG: GldG family protein [Candidatus Omnitrophica bacterium]|nr:GldG family protein [Candidatus Omnitrophota bacterium]